MSTEINFQRVYDLYGTPATTFDVATDFERILSDPSVGREYLLWLERNDATIANIYAVIRRERYPNTERAAVIWLSQALRLIQLEASEL